MLLNKKFILASNSASRKMLLKNAGLSFFTKKPLCDEDYIKDQLLKKNINKKNFPKLLAEAKALSVSKKTQNT
jgi:predicted house-cleaning NTP pyrophosphatase (Maf/HAM1 superfamily)